MKDLSTGLATLGRVFIIYLRVSYLLGPQTNKRANWHEEGM
jgi:hypothetical protein